MPTGNLGSKLSLIDVMPIFSGLSFFQKRYIESRCQTAEFRKGDIIYHEGAHPDFFYCMVSGRVEIYHPASADTKERERRVECVRRGEYFGSISALTGRPHSVSARALNDSVLLSISVKDFESILRKIPKLAVFLSHSLSRRLSNKAVKDIFESKIIAVCCLNGKQAARNYITELSHSIKKESGKKVLILREGDIQKKKDVSSRLSLLTSDYHYILADASSDPSSGIGLELIRQADMRHIICQSDKGSLRKASFLLNSFENAFKKYTSQKSTLILFEDEFYKKTPHREKIKILLGHTFILLPQSKKDHKNTIRRIAREVSGVRVGLALGGGAAFGLAHIGVLKVFEKEDVTIDFITGSSIGALVASLWAAGYSAYEMEKIAHSFQNRFKALSLIDPTLPVRGLIKGKSVRRALKGYFGSKTFFDIRLPLKVVACDIANRSEVVIDKGGLLDAVMSSIAIPGVFEPAEHNNIQLVDGGIVNPVPVDILSRNGIRRIIAVNALPAPGHTVCTRRKRLNIYNVIVNSFQATEFTIAENACRQADIYLHPIPESGNWYEFHNPDVFIKAGRDETKRMLAGIKRLVSQK